MSTANAARTEQPTGPEPLSGHAPTSAPGQPTKGKRRRRRRAKGLGSVYRRKGAQTWTVAWTQNGRQHTESGFPDEDTAERFRKLKVVDVAEGRDPRLKKKHTGTLNDLAEEWLRIRRGTKAEGDKAAVAGTHRSGDQDTYRWNNHLRDAIGHLAPDDLDVLALRRVLEDKLAQGLAPASVQLLQRLVSTFFSDLVERGLARNNPARMLPKKVRQRLRPAHDPRKTGFIERREDIGKLYQALRTQSPTVAVAFAISALAGLRPGEVRALKWANVDLAGSSPKIYVRESVEGPTKSGDAREAPIVASLHTLLTEWKAKNPEPYHGLVCPPLRGGGRRHLDEHTTGRLIGDACEAIGLPRLTYYGAGRHTFASQWVMAGNSIEKLQVVLGHSTPLVTMRYAHLRPDLFSREDLQRADISLAASASETPHGTA